MTNDDANDESCRNPNDEGAIASVSSGRPGESDVGWHGFRGALAFSFGFVRFVSFHRSVMVSSGRWVGRFCKWLWWC
jgi:hypothetical protein